MLWEAAAYAVLGLAAAVAVTVLLPARLPRTPLTLATGPAAALAGGLVARTIFGGGRLELTIPVALVVAVALLSLLARPSRPGRHSTLA
ncbi:hypothetical protein GA0115240_13955 [Streptomyces sp. DvalAA-14]|uniref:hypothetical protein n=1 Tax=unclassified Streptomyces TaxID=2593676 RepID=UPI00081B6092|nr:MULTISPECIES: hypothetical protein [unclassified Streptomyces]MYS22273.1 hypothetical protein [Streptomyces sp. SID4948]SCE12579.1 hypothetical protein GA0115240_13955 [Streptomyces sp. DvalAA-14]